MPEDVQRYYYSGLHQLHTSFVYFTWNLYCGVIYAGIMLCHTLQSLKIWPKPNRESCIRLNNEDEMSTGHDERERLVDKKNLNDLFQNQFVKFVSLRLDLTKYEDMVEIERTLSVVDVLDWRLKINRGTISSKDL